MLHLTSFMQKVSKLNNVSLHIDHLNKKLNKNYSFVYDQNLDRYDFFYNNEDIDDYESTAQGYWGYLRDQNADRKNISSLSSPSELKKTYDGYWGTFKDFHLDEFSNYELLKTDLDKSKVKFDILADIDSNSSPSSEDESTINNADINNSKTDTCATKLIYDVYSSKFKIEAGKRDEMKILMQNLEDKESQFKKEMVKSINQTFRCFRSHKESESLTDSEINLNGIANEASNLKKINFLYFSNLNNYKLTEQQQQNQNNSNNRLNEHKKSIENLSKLETDITYITKSKLSKLSKSSMFLSLNNQESKINLANFKNTFNILNKLNKSINIFNGNYLNIDENYLDNFVSFLNVHASMNDINDLLYNYTNNYNKYLKQNQRKTTTVSLCSNIIEINNDIENSSKPFGSGNSATMLFDHNNVKIGFMGLVDEIVFDKLNYFISKFNLNNKNTNKIEYIDYVDEAKRLSKELKLCGAQIVVALINFESELNEQRLLNEAADLDILFSSTNSNDVSYKTVNNKWLIKCPNNLNSLSLVTLHLDEVKDTKKLVDIAITKYYVD